MSNQTPGTRMSDQTTGTRMSDQTPGTRMSDQTTATQASDQTPGTRMSDQTPGTRMSDQTPGTRMSDQTPATRASEKYRIEVIFKKSHIPQNYDILFSGAKCQIPIEHDLMSRILKLANIVKRLVSKIFEPTNLEHIKLFGGSILHILADAMNKPMPLNDFDFMVEMSETFEKSYLYNFSLLKYVKQLQIDTSLPDITILKVMNPPEYNNRVLKCSIKLNSTDYIFDIVFVSKNSKPHDGLPITDITMNFLASGPTINLTREDHYCNLAQFYHNDPLNFPHLSEVLFDLLNKSYTQIQLERKITQIEQCFLVGCKAVRKGVKIAGLYDGTCAVCGGADETADKNERQLRQILVPLCQNVSIKPELHSMCMFCFIGSVITEKQFPRCIAHCDFDREEYHQLFMPVFPDETAFLSLPFDWNILKRSAFEKPKMKKELYNDPFVSRFRYLCIEAKCIQPSDQRQMQIQEDQRVARNMQSIGQEDD